MEGIVTLIAEIYSIKQLNIIPHLVTLKAIKIKSGEFEPPWFKSLKGITLEAKCDSYSTMKVLADQVREGLDVAHLFIPASTGRLKCSQTNSATVDQ